MPLSGAPGKDAGSQLSVTLDGSQGLKQITWRGSLLEQIRSYTNEAYGRNTASGAEVGGLLFGSRVGDAVQVTEWRPIQRSSGSDSSFFLDSQEESLLRRLIASTRAEATLRGVEVLGWFRSRVRGEARLLESDINLHKRIFTKEYHFCMVVRPSNQRPVQANIFFRDGKGILGASGHFLLNPGPVEVSDSYSPRLPLPAVEIDKGLDSLLTGSPAQRPRANWLRPLGAVFLAIALLIGTIYGLRLQNEAASQTVNPNSLQLKVRPDANGVVISWDANAAPLREASEVKLQINGVIIPLTQGQIFQGSARISMEDPRVKDLPVRLFATAKNGQITEEFTRLIDSSREPKQE